MESNYVISARIKLKRFGVKNYEDVRKHYQEIYDIISEYVDKELPRLINERNWIPVDGYMTFVNSREITFEPDLKPWQNPRTLEYYTRKPQIERIKLK